MDVDDSLRRLFVLLIEPTRVVINRTLLLAWTCAPVYVMIIRMYLCPLY